MRRPLVALSVLSCFGLVACQDGPTQTFQPAPAGAGSVWNDGDSPPVVDPGTQNFTNLGGGQNLQVICNAPKQAAAVKSMDQAPITPSTRIANLDLAGLDPTGKIETWVGLTIEQAEQINCQSTNIGDVFGDGNQDNYWGDDEEVLAEYLVSNHLIDMVTLTLGYQGTMNFKSRDGTNAYIVPIGTPITKNTTPFAMDWDISPPLQSAQFAAEVNELYDAMTATYAPYLPSDPDCTSDGVCIIGNFAQVGYLYFPALGVTLYVANFAAGPPTTNTIIQLNLNPAKILPYSLAAPSLQLSPLGAFASAGSLGNRTPALPACTLTMGISWSNFLNNCVNVTGTSADTTSYNKEIGALSHDDETWTFNVQGVDLNFKSGTLGPTQVVLDNTLPALTDVSTNLYVDQSALGPIANDFNADLTDPTNTTRDLHGGGLVYLQYARNVQAGLNQYIPAAQQHQLGDPACTTGVNPDTLDFPAGCTGFEGFVTAAPTSYTTAGKTTPSQFPGNALGFDVVEINSNLFLGLKPGHPAAAFCLDATGDLATGYNLCNAPQGAQGNLFSTSFARVLQVMGQGNVANLPADAQDVRFFWKQYAYALVQYMEAAGGGLANETEAAVAAQVVDPDELFFDSIGAGQFEIAEYVDRRFASPTTPPTDINIIADVKNGIFNDYSYSRELYRGENAIYQAVLENPADGIGQENTALLTNVFGSPVLVAGWSGSVDGTVSAYQCATDVSGANASACGGQLVPLDANGNALLAPYQGGFASTPFALGPTPIKITTTFSDIQQATVSIPISNPPYGWTSPPGGIGTWTNPSATLGVPLSTLIPWTPQQSGVGFPIPLTGTLNKFIETGNLDFSGTTISASIDYTAVVDPSTGVAAADGSLMFNAVETTDFLGLVFVCQDPSSGDLLTARMYDTVAGIQEWFLAHPNAYSNCGMITTYSPYDNYADYITSVTNGVRLNITQGGGYGRVVDVTLFVPGQ